MEKMEGYISNWLPCLLRMTSLFSFECRFIGEFCNTKGTEINTTKETSVIVAMGGLKPRSPSDYWSDTLTTRPLRWQYIRPSIGQVRGDNFTFSAFSRCSNRVEADWFLCFFGGGGGNQSAMTRTDWSKKKRTGLSFHCFESHRNYGGNLNETTMLWDLSL